MPAIPTQIVLERDRDLSGRRHQIWVRRALFALLVAVPALALANVFGQRPASATRSAGAATLTLYAPARVRSGLLYEARFKIAARRDLDHAALVLHPGWLEGMTVNTIEPSAEAETSEDGRLRLDLGKIEAGRTFLLFMQFQVNPTNVGRRSQRVELRDGDASLLSLGRTITVLP